LGAIPNASTKNTEGKMSLFRKIIEWFKNYAKKQEDKIPKYLSGRKSNRMME
tara:strand:- start:1 stop:156 length:156 start_codon:yes stop_codon:yes gene_type:complete